MILEKSSSQPPVQAPHTVLSLDALLFTAFGRSHDGK